MKRLLHTTAFAFGLALGGGLVYALYTSESARLIVVFLLGAAIFGSTVLLTALFINRQWARAVGEQRMSNHYRYSMAQPQPHWELTPPAQPGLLPPLLKTQGWGATAEEQNIDDEVVA